MKLVWVLAIAGLMAAGCGKKAAPARPEPAAKTEAGAKTEAESTLASRLEAAWKISGSEQRDAALHSVALDAVAAKDVAMVKRAVGMVGGTGNRDRAAEACALALARLNETKAAGEIALMIPSAEARDRTLAAIAAGKVK